MEPDRPVQAIWRRLTDGEDGSAKIDPETIEQLRGPGYVN